MFKRILTIAFVFILAVSCTNNEQQEPVVEETNAVSETCVYSYDNSSTSVNWTAFKLTEKTGVKGKFDSVEVVNTVTSEFPEKVLEGATFTIYTSSSNSGDAERDGKIAMSFFGQMTATETITGKVVEMKDGVSKMELTMNGATVSIEGVYEVEENDVKIRATLNIPDWGAQDALNALNQVCSLKHTGTDGVNKLWPDVDVVVSTTLNKDCK